MSSARTADEILTRLAATQHGVVARAQLVAAGVGPDLIDHRLRSGRLRRVHRGVYQVGPVCPPGAREMSAVLACGGDAFVSHRSAAVLWKMTPPHERRGPVDITVTSGHPRTRSDIRVHRVRTLGSIEVGACDGIPITSPARTLFDLADSANDRNLERTLAEALALRIVDEAAIRSVLARHHRRRGTARLLRLLEGGPGTAARTRSEAEERFLALVRRAGLPSPAANTGIAGCEVDFLWRAERLVVEVDGRAYHASSNRFERDRRRDATLLAAGYRVMRVTWEQIVKEPEALLVTLTRVLLQQP